MAVSCNSKSFSELCESTCEQSTDWATECLAASGMTVADIPEEYQVAYDADACVSQCNSSAELAETAGCRDDLKDYLTCVDKVDFDSLDCGTETSECDSEAQTFTSCMQTSGTSGSGSSGSSGSCTEGEIVDCYGDCVPASWIGDGDCEDYLNCEEFAYDGGDCDGEDTGDW